MTLAPSANAATAIRRVGRVFALAGVVLPLALIGGLKFTQFELKDVALLGISLVVLGESMARASGRRGPI